MLSEALILVSQLVEDFGLSLLPVKNLLEWSKEDLASANAGVRNAVIQLLGIMHRCGKRPDLIGPLRRQVLCGLSSWGNRGGRC